MLNVELFEKLSVEYDSSVVWFDERDNEYCFCMNDELDDVESDLFEKVVEKKDYIECWVGYGDDIMNCVRVKDLSLLNELEVRFIVKYVGSNCYSREE